MGEDINFESLRKTYIEKCNKFYDYYYSLMTEIEMQEMNDEELKKFFYTLEYYARDLEYIKLQIKQNDFEFLEKQRNEFGKDRRYIKKIQ